MASDTSQRVAVAAVVKHFGTTLDEANEPSSAHFSIAQTRVALHVVTLDQPTGLAKPRLRFDGVALRVVRHVQAVPGDAVPADLAGLVTVTAPIRHPAKTAAALADQARACLATSAPYKGTLHDNQVQVRPAKSHQGGLSRVMGLVHNPETDADLLLDSLQAWLACVDSAARRPAPGRTVDEHWLAVVAPDATHLEAYRQACLQLACGSSFDKLLLVLPGGKIVPLQA